jgi:hypothetical protein
MVLLIMQMAKRTNENILAKLNNLGSAEINFDSL